MRMHRSGTIHRACFFHKVPILLQSTEISSSAEGCSWWECSLWCSGCTGSAALCSPFPNQDVTLALTLEKSTSTSSDSFFSPDSFLSVNKPPCGLGRRSLYKVCCEWVHRVRMTISNHFNNRSGSGQPQVIWLLESKNPHSSGEAFPGFLLSKIGRSRLRSFRPIFAE